MICSWVRPIEQVAFSAMLSSSRVIGITSVEGGAGVSTLSRAVAEVLALSGARVLLVDLSVALSGWGKGFGGAGSDDMWGEVTTEAAGFNFVAATPTDANRLLYNDVNRLRSTFARQLSHYDSIILDLPSLLDASGRRLNPLGPAVTCDSVLLTCVRGHTNREDVSKGVAALQMGRANLAGMVMNNIDYHTPGEEIARLMRWLAPVMPRIAGRLEERALRSALLN